MAIRNVTQASVGLVVGIIILAALVFGGLWIVRDRGEQARRTEAIHIADQQLQAEKDKKVAQGTDKEANKDSGKKGEPNDSTQTPTPTSTDTPSSAEVLPQTGVGESLVGVVALTALTFTAASYFRSRLVLK